MQSNTSTNDRLLLWLILGFNFYVVYLLLVSQSNCRVGKQPDNEWSKTLRQFVEELGKKLELDIDSRMDEIEETIFDFEQNRADLGYTGSPTPASPTATAPSNQRTRIPSTSNVLTCSKPPVSVKEFSQDWTRSKGRTYQGCAEAEFLEWVHSLRGREKHVFSQNNEDGITEAIFERIGSGNKFYVEFGVENGTECNTRILRENHGWKGIMFDNNNSRPEINLFKESVWVDNILELFDKHSIPKSIDFLSIDTNFADLWLLDTLLSAGYEPRAFVIEFNVNQGPFAALTIPFDRAMAHETDRNDKYFGGSVHAIYKVASNYGYELLYVESHVTNAFFIKRSEISNMDIARLEWTRTLTPNGSGHGVDPLHRPFAHVCSQAPCHSSKDCLKSWR